MLSLNWGHKRRNVVSSQQGAQGACRPPSWPHGCTSWWRPSHPCTSLENQFLEIFFMFFTISNCSKGPPSLFQSGLSEMNNFRARSPIILNILSFWAWRLQDKRDIFCESSILISVSAAGTHSLVETYLSFKGIMKVLVKRFIFTQSRDFTHILISS